MRNKLIVLGVVLLIGAWIFFDARSDYSWSEMIVEKKSAEGWTLAATQDNFVDLVRPWTWFNTPVTGPWFVKPEQLRRLDSSFIVIAPILRVSYDYSRTEQETYVECFDVANGKSAFLPESTPIESVSLSQLKWHDYPSGTPGDKLIKYIQKTSGAR
jgi:hypothetical protein